MFHEKTLFTKNLQMQTVESFIYFGKEYVFKVDKAMPEKIKFYIKPQERVTNH